MSLRRKQRSAWRESVLGDFGTPVEQRTREAQKRRLAARSEKQEQVYEVRRELVRQVLIEKRRCEAGRAILTHLFSLDPGLAIGGGKWKSVRGGLTCGGEDAPDDVHELLPRSAGGSITERANCIAVCRTCHRWIHEHPAASRRLGLLKSRYGDA
jgi:hypothetical protein